VFSLVVGKILVTTGVVFAGILDVEVVSSTLLS